MQIPVINQGPVRSKYIPLRGGINEAETFDLMGPGELISCVNYETEVGPYPGYKSVGGYEVFDGKVATPSSVAAPVFIDEGNDKRTALLLSSDNGITDSSRLQKVITNSGVTLSTERNKFFSRSFKVFDSSLSVPSFAALADKDFCFDFWIFKRQRDWAQPVFKQQGTIEVSVDSNNLLQVTVNGLTLNYTLTSSAALTNNAWIHVAIVKYGTSLTLYLQGVSNDTDTVNENLGYVAANPLVIGGADTEYYLSQFRLSTETPRFVKAFVTPSISYTTDGYFYEVFDDTAREVARAAIGLVPGTGTLVGGFTYEGDVYVAKYDPVADFLRFYEATLTSWSEVSQVLGSEVDGDATSKIRSIEYRFEGFNSNQPVIVFTTGTSKAYLFNGTTFTEITSADLPAAVFPVAVGAYDNRLYLGYDGSIFFSAVGDPEDFTAISNAGEILLGDTVTNVTELPGNALLVTTNTFTEVIKSVGGDADWSFQKETISRTIGGAPDTAVNILGDVYWASKHGVVNMQLVDVYSDFHINVVSKKTNNTYKEKYDTLLKAVVEKNKGQYKLYYTDGTCMVFSFNEEKFVRDITFLDYDIPMSFVFSDTLVSDPGEINERAFFGNTASLRLYELDKGTSFNGDVIPTFLQTAFHSFNSLSIWKRFRRTLIDVDAEIGTRFFTKFYYSYGDSLISAGILLNKINDQDRGTPWGTEDWAAFRWGGTIVRSLPIYNMGVGIVLSMAARTSSKYHSPHNIKSLLVDYSVGKRRV